MNERVVGIASLVVLCLGAAVFAAHADSDTPKASVAVAEDVQKAELEALMNALLPLSDKTLRQYGEFAPYAGVVQNDGQYRFTAAPESASEGTVDAVAILTAGLRAGAARGDYRAAGVVSEVRVVPPGTSDETSAVRVALEHVAGVSLEVYLPYTMGDQYDVAYGSLFAAPREARIFLVRGGSSPAPVSAPARSGDTE